MQRLSALILTFLIVLNVPGLSAQQAPTTSDVPLQVIDTSPLAGEELGSQEPIILFFDQISSITAILSIPTQRASAMTNRSSRSLPS